MAFCPFSYTVVIHNNYDENTNTNHYIRESGMGLAQSYAHAMEILENYYDMDLIAVKHLELFEENNVILLPEAVIRKYSTDDTFNLGEPCDAQGNLLTTLNQEASASEC